MGYILSISPPFLLPPPHHTIILVLSFLQNETPPPPTRIKIELMELLRSLDHAPSVQVDVGSQLDDPDTFEQESTDAVYQNKELAAL